MELAESLFINGSWRKSSGDGAIDVIDSATQAVLLRVPMGSATDVDLAVGAARQAFPIWSATTLDDRLAILDRALEALTDRAEEIASVVSREVGTPLTSSRQIQAALAISDVRNTLEAARAFTWESQIGNSLIAREPAGVVAAITPWNYPLHQVCAKVAPALIAGCTVVLKPAELAPQSAFILAEVLAEAGLPDGVFNLVPGLGRVVGQALCEHRDVDMVSFTGSVAAGRSVMQTAAGTIKRVALELGGKSAMVVLDGAPLESAVNRAVVSCLSNNGQTCSALTRLIVPQSRLAEVEEIAAATIAKQRVGDPADADTTVGPMVSKEQQHKVLQYIDIGVDEGATLIAGGSGPVDGASGGFFVAPTVLSSAVNSMRVAQEEIFGPVLVILSARDEADAVNIANGTDFGLSGAVWGGDNGHALAVARQLRTGQVSVNGGAFNPAAPFGGYRQSGIGRELGTFGLEEFLETKAMHR